MNNFDKRENFLRKIFLFLFIFCLLDNMIHICYDIRDDVTNL